MTGGATAVEEEDDGALASVLLALAVEAGRGWSQSAANIEPASLFRCVSRLSNT